jgi:hypothetical protein
VSRVPGKIQPLPLPLHAAVSSGKSGRMVGGLVNTGLMEALAVGVRWEAVGMRVLPPYRCSRGIRKRGRHGRNGGRPKITTAHRRFSPTVFDLLWKFLPHPCRESVRVSRIPGHTVHRFHGLYPKGLDAHSACVRACGSPGARGGTGPGNRTAATLASPPRNCAGWVAGVCPLTRQSRQGDVS